MYIYILKRCPRTSLLIYASMSRENNSKLNRDTRYHIGISTSEIIPDPDRENNLEHRENQENLDQIKTESALSVAPSVNDTEL